MLEISSITDLTTYWTEFLKISSSISTINLLILQELQDFKKY